MGWIERELDERLKNGFRERGFYLLNEGPARHAPIPAGFGNVEKAEKYLKGLPGRRRRFCCDLLKEYKIMDYAVIGVRRDESDTRAQYEEPTTCMEYKKDVTAELYMPLLDFTAKNIADFIEARGIKCHPLYYDEQGRFHVERRLGCVGCPLAYRKHRIQEFKQVPGMVRLYVHAAQKFLDNHPNSKMFAYLKDASDWFVMSLYCDSVADFKKKFGATLLTPPIDCKAFLEDTFNIKL